MIADLRKSLHEFTKEEWWSVVHMLRPEITWEIFEAQWEEYLELRRRRTLH